MISNITYSNFTTKFNIFDHDDLISTTINSTGTFYEEPFLTWVKNNYPTHDKILDIGANIGNHSVFFSNILTNNEVYSFEPVPVNLHLLKQNVSGMNVKVLDVALSDVEGTAEIYNSQPHNFGGFTLEAAKFPGHTPIITGYTARTITLDSLNLDGVTMIKIDVENHESNVLKGAKETIIRNKPIIFIENLNHGHPNVCPPNKFDSFFDSIGYTLKESNILGGFMDLWVSKEVTN